MVFIKFLPDATKTEYLIIHSIHPFAFHSYKPEVAQNTFNNLC